MSKTYEMTVIGPEEVRKQLEEISFILSLQGLIVDIYDVEEDGFKANLLTEKEDEVMQEFAKDVQRRYIDKGILCDISIVEVPNV